MQLVRRRYTDLSLLLIACVALGACKGKENAPATDTTSAAATPAPTDTGAGAAAAAPSSPATLSDANIVALLDEVNMADSMLGAAALPKATNSQVKSFAKLMMGEHHALRLQGQQLAKKQNITPQAPTDDPFKSAVDNEQTALSSAAKGHAFDSTYIANEVGIHQAVINWAGTAETQAQNQALKDLIKAAGPVLQKHLDRAQQIQKTLH
jgi:putative membrane protein